MSVAWLRRGSEKVGEVWKSGEDGEDFPTHASNYFHKPVVIKYVIIIEVVYSISS